MLTIGLTGGIGSGKTTVAEIFADLGVAVIDTDEIARQLTAPGQPLLNDIRRQFGTAVFNSDNTLNRSSLAKFIFNNNEARQQLETILHPAIWQVVDEQLQSLDADYCILVVPLLIETQHTERVDRLLVVDSPEALQISRTQQRDHRSEADIRAIMQSQIDRDTRLSLADDVIDNSDSDRKSLDSQVAMLHRKYLALAQQNSSYT